MLAPIKTSTDYPIRSYAEAIKQVEHWNTDEENSVSPLCRTILMTHGDPTEYSIVLVHGYTSCPEQFRKFGMMLYERGHNVLIGRQPHHGLVDRLTSETEKLSAEMLVDAVNQWLDLARALGGRVTMVGISGGGVLSAWAAQYRSDLERAVLISPAFGFGAIPTRATRLAMILALKLPNSYQWWDAKSQVSGAPPHAYPRYSTRVLAQYLRLGFAVADAARKTKPAAGLIQVVTNRNDSSVNNALTAAVVASWRAHGANIREEEFGAELGLAHDLIDPSQPGEQTGLVYERLLQLMAL